MSYYGTLITAIKQVIKENGNQEITGQILQDILVSMIDDLGAYPTFAGIVYPDAQEVAPTAETETGEKMEIEQDANVFYLAFAEGQYNDFGVELDGMYYHIFRRTQDGWEVLNTNIKTSEAIAQAIASALEEYSTTAQVAEAIVVALKPFITKAESAQAIIDALVPYAKTSEVATAITEALQPYATTEAVNQALEPYATTEEVTEALQPYATTEAVNQALEPYATTEEVTEALQPYAKTEDVEQAIEESKTDLTDVELVAAAALNDLNERVNALLGSDELATLIDGKIEELRQSLTGIIDTLRSAVIDNELVTAAALNDLNSRI